jgi:putative heme-binding domain-containing protein
MLVKISAFILTAGSLFAQHGYTPGDVQDGERLYLANCAVCHGPDGNMVPGTDLAHGVFRRANTDEGLLQIIKAGIPGTAMPPHTFRDAQALTIVAFLRSMAATAQSATAPGDPVNGKALFEGKGNCQSCHRVLGVGSRLGPDLSDIGANRRAGAIQKSILDPDAEILPQNRFVRVVAKDGTATTGREWMRLHGQATGELARDTQNMQAMSVQIVCPSAPGGDQTPRIIFAQQDAIEAPEDEILEIGLKQLR